MKKKLVLINNCLNIENIITELNKLNKNFKKCNNENIDGIKFVPDEENKINEFMEIIKSFWNFMLIIFLNLNNVLKNK